MVRKSWIVLLLVVFISVTSFERKSNAAALVGLATGQTGMFYGGILGYLFICGAITFGVGIIIPFCFLDEKGNITSDTASLMQENGFDESEVAIVSSELRDLKRATGYEKLQVIISQNDTVEEIKQSLSRYSPISNQTAQLLLEMSRAGVQR